MGASEPLSDSSQVGFFGGRRVLADSFMTSPSAAVGPIVTEKL